MINDTPDRKRLALALLALGRTIQQILSELQIKRHTLRYWKQSDDRFRLEWNLQMDKLGRVQDPL